MFLNRRFEQLLHKRLGQWADQILTPNCLQEAFSMFDTRIKGQFNPLSGDCEDSYKIPLPGAFNLRQIGLDGGFLSVTRSVSLRTQNGALF
jgi:hypothetical protein